MAPSCPTVGRAGPHGTDLEQWHPESGAIAEGVARVVVVDVLAVM